MTALAHNSPSAARLAEFERLLDDIGVLSEAEGRVAHALGSVISHNYNSSARGTDAPEKSFSVSAAPNLWSYLLVDACLTAPRRTANKLLRWVRGAPLPFETRALLGRLNAASSFALAGGLAVERLPRRNDRLEGWFPVGTSDRRSDYLDRTLLRIPCRISPVLTKPAKITRDLHGTLTQTWEMSATMDSSWPLPPGGISELGRALSLVSDVAVEMPMSWLDYGEHGHFGQRVDSSSYGIGSRELPLRTDTHRTLTAADLKAALRLQPTFRNMPRSVHTAFEYWLESKARGVDLADCLVFLRTALEALFLDRGNNAELAYRLATNGAWYTGRNPAERRQRFSTLKNVYAAASGAVHSGRVKKPADTLLTDGQEICRLAILKRLRSGQEPVWKDIVFGR
ncbi:MAG: hypothetical protein F4186_07770 [Boseongicola sp. SB0676_bin_33]|nr:hypothetical protein [Boseongicola sp. SB0676_bin_33]